MLHCGDQVKGVVDDVYMFKMKLIRGTKFTTTVSYHFVARDGTQHTRTAITVNPTEKFVFIGENIVVHYDPERPDTSAWRTELELKIRDFHAGLIPGTFISLWLGLFLYRYTRWRRNRSRTCVSVRV